MRKAEVFRNGFLAGLLTETDARQYIFAYDPVYYYDKNQPGISLTLSKDQPEYYSDFLFPFFYNMLSEGSNRLVQSRLLHIDDLDHFGLLLATAQFDTVGAITVKPIE